MARSRPPWRVLLALLLTASACGDTTGPLPSETRQLEVVSGDGQRGLSGDELVRPVAVRVVDGLGRPVFGELVRFSVAAGSGSVSTETGTSAANGVVSTSWRLLGNPGDTRTLRAELESSPTESVTVSARILAPEEVDLVVVHGALAPLRGVVLVGSDETGGVHVLFSRSAPDTLVYLPPTDQKAVQVVIFGRGNRPWHAEPPWTEGVDTVHVTLDPPIPVDFTFDVLVGSFEDQKVKMTNQLRTMEAIWREQAMGVALGRVTFLDHTDPLRGRAIQSTGVCYGLEPGEDIRVTLVTNIDGGFYGGWGCLSGDVFIGLNGQSPNLLAHEVGHTFTLVHTTSGLMYARTPGTTVRDGEVYRAHFGNLSVLNTIFAGQPVDRRRPCHLPGPPAICLPADFELPRAVSKVAVNDAPAPSTSARPVDGLPLGAGSALGRVRRR